MTINITRWSPDTCQCVIEYDWDSTLTEDQRVHTLKTISKCPIHAALSNTTAYTTVLDENPRKNMSHQFVLDNGPTLLYDIVNGTRQLKPNISLQFTFSGIAPNRVLTIAFNDSNGNVLNTQQKNAIQTLLNNRFGVGKVVIA